MKPSTFLGFASLLSWGHAQSSPLWNGAHRDIFSDDLSDECDAALNTPIGCPLSVQLLVPHIQTVDWNTAALNELCTKDCEGSLEILLHNVEAACSDDFYLFDNRNTSWTEHVEYFQYKFGLVCMRDLVSSEYCSDIEESWNITEMVASDSATWPSHTGKCYTEIVDGRVIRLAHSNGTCRDPNEDRDTPLKASELAPKVGSMAALDYFYNRTVIDDDNFGWADELEDDEYPLEMQCSYCFIEKFKYGLSSQFGEIWDEITEQVWSNMKKNCNIDDTVTPAHNMTGRTGDITEPVQQYIDVSTCPQQIEIREPTDCDQVALANSVASAALRRLNPHAYCQYLLEEVLCAPEPCIIGTNTGDATSVPSFVEQYSNFTQSQFLRWNPFIDLSQIMPDEVVCIGPPGGAYVPQLMPSSGSSSTSMAPQTNTTTITIIPPTSTTTITKTVLVTTSSNTTSGSGTGSSSDVATPTPTQTGMTTACLEFYQAVDGDTCDKICSEHGIALEEFQEWNPSVGDLCYDLWVGYWYCVGR